MATRLRLGDLSVEVVLKDIKNVHLSVLPPTGKVRISAPMRMSISTIRLFAISKLSWIRSQQRKLSEQEREMPREHLDRESHYVWGKRYLMKVVEDVASPQVRLTHRQMILRVPPGATRESKDALVARWYRDQIRAAVPDLVAKWTPVLGVELKGVFVQKMKTRWGSCNPNKQTIRLNTDLAKKLPQCLEYVLVHELIHLLERQHNDAFRRHMDRVIPQWRLHREELNRSPLSHETWEY
jgi:predicted metal-dependent hydrolase